jgi:L-idonate 5-dehydrogenase
MLSGTYPLAQAVTALELAGDRTRFVKLHLALNP